MLLFFYSIILGMYIDLFFFFKCVYVEGLCIWYLFDVRKGYLIFSGFLSFLFRFWMINLVFNVLYFIFDYFIVECNNIFFNLLFIDR